MEPNVLENLKEAEAVIVLCAFAEGLCQATRSLKKKNPGVYMRCLLSFKERYREEVKTMTVEESAIFKGIGKEFKKRK